MSRDTTDTKPTAEGQRMSDREALQDQIARAIHAEQFGVAWDKGDYSDDAEHRADYLRYATAVMPIVEQLQADNEALRERLATADDDLARWRSFSERIRQDATAIPDDEPMDVVEDLPAYLRDLEVQHLMADNEALRQVVAKVTAIANSVLTTSAERVAERSAPVSAHTKEGQQP